MSLATLLNTNYYSRNEQFDYTLPHNTYYSPLGFNDMQVAHDGHTFCVITKEGDQYIVPNGNVSSELRGISIETLQKMLKVGYLTINKAGDNFAIQYRGRLLGGGFLFATLAYVGTNIVGGLTVAVGVVTVNPAICAGGAAIITAAPYVLAATLPTPTP